MNGKRLKSLREEKGLTQKTLAEQLNLTPKAISFYELGTREPTCNALLNMAKILDTTTDYLLGNDRIPTPTNDMTQFLSQESIVFDGNVIHLTDKSREILRQSLKIAFMAVKNLKEE